jgi:hypothetical protein
VFISAIHATWKSLPGRLLRWFLGATVLLTLITNALLIPLFNAHVIPAVEAEGASVLQRSVSVQGVRWVSPPGIFGVGPLMCTDAVAIGPGVAELSELELAGATVHVRPLASLLGWRLVLDADLLEPRVTVRQAENYSWFGYPDDTSPSARNFLPGLQECEGPNDDTRGGGCTAHGVGGGRALGGGPPSHSAHSQGSRPVAQRNWSGWPFADSKDGARRGCSQYYSSGAAKNATRDETVAHCSGGHWQHATRHGEARRGMDPRPRMTYPLKGGRSASEDYCARQGLNGTCSHSVPPSAATTQVHQLPAPDRGVSIGQLEQLRRCSDAWHLSPAKQHKSHISVQKGQRPPVPSTSAGLTSLGGGSEASMLQAHSSHKLQEQSWRISSSETQLGGEVALASSGMPMLASSAGIAQSRSVLDPPSARLRQNSVLAAASTRKSVVSLLEPQVAVLPQNLASTLGSTRSSGRQTSADLSRIRLASHFPCNPRSLASPLESVSSFSRARSMALNRSFLALPVPSSSHNLASAVASTSASSRSSAPAVAVRNVTLSDAIIHAYAYHDTTPRVFTGVSGTLSFSCDMHGLELLMSADAHDRADSNFRCTMPTNPAGRNLRDCTPGATESAPLLNYPLTQDGPSPAARATFKSTAKNLQCTNLSDLSELALIPTTSNSTSIVGVAPDIAAGAPQKACTATRSRSSIHEPPTKDPESWKGTCEAAASPGPSISNTASSPSVSVQLHKEPMSEGCTNESAPSDGVSEAALGTQPSASVLSDKPDSPRELEAQNIKANSKCPVDVSVSRSGEKDDQEAATEEGDASGAKAANNLKESVSPGFQDGVQGSGKVEVQVSVVDMAVMNVCPQVTVSVRGKGLHAPLLERLLELPMDIYRGRLDGEIRIHLERPDHWTVFPGFSGCVQVYGSSFHFWDSPDDFTGTDMTLLFEEDRMHVLDGKGAYGAVQLTAHGEMGLNPEYGEYNIQV